MTTENRMLVFESPIGLIALSIEVVQTARRDAECLFRDSSHTDLDPDKTKPTALLDARGIAELFGMDPTWFLTRAREGRIPHVRLGKFVRFDPVEIRAYFDN